MEIVGEFLSYDTEEGIYEYFLWHWLGLFPVLRQIHRSDFVRQASRLAKVKVWLWRQILARIPYDAQLSLVDSFPLYACQFARAKRCRRFVEDAAFGHDQLIKQTFYGFRWHLRINWPGVITEVLIAPANLHDLHPLPELLEGASGWALADRNYWSPPRAHQLWKDQQLLLVTPPKKRSQDAAVGWTHWLTQVRRRIETVIGQLVERYRAKRTWARDLWHLGSRIFRKVLSHTVAVWLSLQRGGEPLQFDHLLAH
ncbi:IS982 family transposase [Candidatus Acetothermia bacterium]|nr:IS982 family transposase [Candidatus Acetothermia bacterium]